MLFAVEKKSSSVVSDMKCANVFVNSSTTASLTHSLTHSRVCVCVVVVVEDELQLYPIQQNIRDRDEHHNQKHICNDRHLLKQLLQLM